jgi:AraC-like DNA-binding protein
LHSLGCEHVLEVFLAMAGTAMTSRAKHMTSSATPARAAEPTVAAGVARGLLNVAVAHGAGREALLSRSGIAAEALDDPDARIPYASYVALMRAGQALSGDPALALHYAEEVNLSEVSVVGLITHACETMGEAFAQLARYSRLVTEYDSGATRPQFVRVPAENDRHWLVDQRSNPNAFPEASEMAFARLAVGPRVFDTTPFCREVHFTHAEPSYRSEYDRIFQAPIVFESDKNAMLVDDSWSHHRIAPKQRYAFGVLTRHADALLRQLAGAKSTRGQVENVLLPVLHTGDVGMDVVARKLGVSPRTLSRRLKAEGATYERVLDELRRELARHYLDGRRVSVTETAYLVGFSDPAAFSRAFKRWTGASPRGTRGR